jgi:predicted metal-binding membrane protein
MAAAALPRRAALLTTAARQGLRSHAFRWAIAPAAAAWLALFAMAVEGLDPAFCLGPAVDPVHRLLAALNASFAGFDPTAAALGWILMLAAMMGPLLAPMVTYVAARSFVDRRDLAVGEFVAGYAVVWIVAAGVALVALLMLHALTLYAGVAAWSGCFGAATAALWQLSGRKRRALNRCHGVIPLRASGPAADWDSVRFGLLHGSRCVRACAPTMFLTMGGSHALMTMAVVFAVLLAERTSSRPRQSGAAALLLLTGLLSAPLA